MNSLTTTRILCPPLFSSAWPNGRAELVLGARSDPRMPAILQPEDEPVWVDPEVTAAEAVLPLLRPYAAELMEACTLAARALRLAEAAGT